VPVPLPAELLELLRRPSLCFMATIMPDGSPQLTQTWVTTDGEHILINTPDWSQKARNVARDQRVAVNVADADDTRRYFAVRGRVPRQIAGLPLIVPAVKNGMDVRQLAGRPGSTAGLTENVRRRLVLVR
jgi:PPOX class probable F420-dependent enzyme